MIYVICHEPVAYLLWKRQLWNWSQTWYTRSSFRSTGKKSERDGKEQYEDRKPSEYSISFTENRTMNNGTCVLAICLIQIDDRGPILPNFKHRRCFLLQWDSTFNFNYLERIGWSDSFGRLWLFSSTLVGIRIHPWLSLLATTSRLAGTV